MDRWIDAHWDPIRVLAGDALVHFEQIAVALFDPLASETPERVGKIQVHAEAGLTDAAALVAYGLGVSRRHIARHEVSKTRIAPLEVVVALGFRDLLW